jgi:hypothetical protein
MKLCEGSVVLISICVESSIDGWFTREERVIDGVRTRFSEKPLPGAR